MQQGEFLVRGAEIYGEYNVTIVFSFLFFFFFFLFNARVQDIPMARQESRSRRITSLSTSGRVLRLDAFFKNKCRTRVEPALVANAGPSDRGRRADQQEMGREFSHHRSMRYVLDISTSPQPRQLPADDNDPLIIITKSEQSSFQTTVARMFIWLQILFQNHPHYI